MAIIDLAHALIVRAATEIEKRTKNYKVSQDFYDGRHPAPPATERWTADLQEAFEMIRDNLCPLVVDGLVSRLKVSGFAPEVRHTDPDDPKLFDYPDGEAVPEPRVGIWRKADDPTDRQAEMERRRAEDVWSHNRMDAKQREIHREAGIKGDAFVIVWTGPDGRASIEPNDPELCHVEYDPSQPTQKLWAAKRWHDTILNRVRVDLYYGPRVVGGARIEKYISVRESKDVKAETKPADWEPHRVSLGIVQVGVEEEALKPDGTVERRPKMIRRPNDQGVEEEVQETAAVEQWEPWPLPNPYDDVPVFHNRNKGKTGRYGVSELEPVAPIQLALNKEIQSLLLTSEQYGIPFRAITGLRPELGPDGKPLPIDFKPLIDRILAVWGEGVAMQQFAAAELAQHIGVINDLRTEMGRLSQTPPYMMFMVTGEQPSGEMLKVVDAPFDAKVDDRQTVTGNFWEDVLAFAVKVDTGNQVALRYSIEWADTAPKSQAEVAQTGESWLRLGVPRKYVWKRLLGFTERECEELFQMYLDERAAEPLPPPPGPGEPGAPDDQGRIQGQPPNGPPPGRTPAQLRPYAERTRQMTGAGTAAAPPAGRPKRRR